MKKTTDVVIGKIENVKRIATRTENSMITFMVGKTPCKAFGKGAEKVTSWVQADPNSVGEFEGYFDKRSERFGKEFVAAHGKLIDTGRIADGNGLGKTSSGLGAPREASASAASAPTEPIPAKEPLVLETDLAAKDPLPHSPAPPTRAPVHCDVAPVKPVTFEDLENQYKAQKMKRQLEKSK